MSADQEHNDRAPKRDRLRLYSKRWWLLLLVVCVLVLVAIYAIQNQMAKARQRAAAQQRGAPQAVTPVQAVPAGKADFQIFVTALGSVTPINTVTVRTRVDGQLNSVFYREGQIVQSGELLARIDPRPFEVQLLQAQGQMARDEAQLKNAEIDLERFRLLWSQDSISRQQVDTQEALVRQLLGTIKNDWGLIEAAKLNLVYTRIRAPITGRVGLRLVDPGNIVHASDTNGLLVITQLQPISVIFAIPEDNLSAVLPKLKAGQRLLTEAYNRDMTQKIGEGYLLTADNQVDQTTGTVRLRSLFPNPQNELFPGQFVNVRLLVDVIRGATVIPAAAIQRGPQGTFVYLVRSDQTVTARPVTVGQIQTGAAAIQAGLSPGDIVVTEGIDRLREGARVRTGK
jgi:multidrug efflux system membrane fusion protein